MSCNVRRHLTFANICSFMALVIALSMGSAYAAGKVRSKDIVDGQVKSADLHQSAVSATKLKKNAVTSAKVLDGSILTADVTDDAITQDKLASNAVGPDQLATDSVGASEVADSSLDSGEIVDNSLFATDLAANSVGGSELQDGAVDGAKVVNDSLTFADLASGGSAGNVSVPANAVANGRCNAFTVGISGATVGDAVVMSVRGPMQTGVFFYATQVTAAGSASVVLCNHSSGAQAAITDLPVRILTFH